MNLQEFNDLLPKSARFYGLEDFYTDKYPTRGRVGQLQLYWLRRKMENYCSAVVHLLSTGQGVVITSSIWSEIMYAEALFKSGYVTKNFYEYHTEFWKDVVPEAPPPHLCIYLDAPISTIRERMNKRADPKEMNTKVITDKYLEDLDNAYKTTLSKRLKKTSEVITLDWTEVADDLDMDVIAEEIETINLEYIDPEHGQFQDWHYYTEDELAKYRRILCRDGGIRRIFDRPEPWKCPEILYDPEDNAAYDQIVVNHPMFQLGSEHYDHATKYRLGVRDLPHNFDDKPL